MYQPNKTVALLLNFFFLSLGMVYVMRFRLALIYFLAGIVLYYLEAMFLMRAFSYWPPYFSLVQVVILIGMFHVFLLARRPLNTPRAWYSRWYGLPVVLVFVYFLPFAATKIFVLDSYFARSESMMPAIKPGAFVLVNKWGSGIYTGYGLKLRKGNGSYKPKHGDIIVFEQPTNRNSVFVKRVVAVPGDSVIYRQGSLKINGKLVKSTLVSKAATDSFTPGVSYSEVQENLRGKTYSVYYLPGKINRENGKREFKLKVKKNNYFVLGDNRDNSLDSRHWGTIPMSHIVGKVIFISN